jgi:hypothetical protein
MRVSHETIYQSLFVQARGSLRKELTACLRTGRTRRRSRGRAAPKGRMADMVMIADRPPEASDRAIPGNWEGDLIIGKNGKSSVGTLVERNSRFLMPLRLPHGRTAEHVRAVLLARSRGSQRLCDEASRGTKARKWQDTFSFPLTPTSACSSATRTAHGNAGATRTRTGCSASTSPRGST